MSVATVRLKGFSNQGINTTYPISFDEDRIKIGVILSVFAGEIPIKSPAFFALNGIKASEDSWVSNGDIIDIFQIVTGG
jgi:hypothetical protein